MEEEIIHIALSLYDKRGDYSRHVGAVLASIFENTTAKIQIHLLHDDTLLEENKEKFEILIEQYEQFIEFHYVDLPQSINQYKEIDKLSRGSLFRCYICEILLDINKVIYLDSDIIVNLDIRGLWNECLNGYCIGGVIDGGDYRKNMKLNQFYDNVRIKSDKYFNSGVLVMQLQQIRERYSLSEKCLKFLDENANSPTLDQDALNYLFQNSCAFLDEKYNLIVNQHYKNSIMKEPDKDKKCIWHFAGFIKPWEMCEYPISTLYWEYFHKTPWGEKTEDIIRYMSKMNNDNFPLENVVMSQRIGSRKKFIERCMGRIFKEIKDKYFSFT